MGQLVSVIRETSSNHGIVRFDTNRTFTGMGHEHYEIGTEVVGNRPPDMIAKALLATGQVARVHVYAQTITVTLAPGNGSEGLSDLIETLYVHYRPGVEVPTAESFS